MSTDKYIFEPIDGDDCRLVGLTEAFRRGRPVTWFTIPAVIDCEGHAYNVSEVDPEMAGSGPKVRAKWYFKAKKAGNPYADHWLKQLYADLMHTNMEKALELFMYMGGREEVNAMFWMAVAVIELEKIGKVPDMGVGIKMMREAADKGSSDACRYLEEKSKN